MTAATAGWDVVVVGAGLGGLVCSAYLAAAGRRTLVLDAHDVAGGAAQAFRRRGRYEFDVGAHYLGGCSRGGINAAILRGLGLAGRVAFEPLDPDGFDRILAPGLDLRVPQGWERYRARLHEALPGEEAAVDLAVAVLAAVASGTGLESGRDADAAGPGGVDPRWARRTLGDLLAQAGLSPRGQLAIAAQCLNLGVAPHEASVARYAVMLDGYVRYGAHTPVGGGQALVAALVEMIESHGGEVRTRAGVHRILVDDGRVTGVRLADGGVVAAPVVVSGADYRTTLADLVGPEHLPASLLSRAARMVPSHPLAVLYLALDRDPGWPRDQNLWVFDAADARDCYSRLDQVSFAVVSPASARAVEGHRGVEVLTMLPRGDGGRFPAAYRRDPGYRAYKAFLHDRLLDLAEGVLGPFRRHVVHAEVSTAQTHARYTAATDGAAYGLAAIPSQTGPFRPGYRTPVEGLFLTGSSTRAGSGFTGAGLGGVDCAGEVLGRPLRAEVLGGAVLGCADRLPQRAPGWDALGVSRGRARAHLRVPPGPGRG